MWEPIMLSKKAILQVPTFWSTNVSCDRLMDWHGQGEKIMPTQSDPTPTVTTPTTPTPPKDGPKVTETTTEVPRISEGKATTKSVVDHVDKGKKPNSFNLFAIVAIAAALIALVVALGRASTDDLATKVSQVDHDALKVEVGDKADAAKTAEALKLKADKTEVAALKTEVDALKTDVALKASQADVDALKVDVADKSSQADVDDLKSDVNVLKASREAAKKAWIAGRDQRLAQSRALEAAAGLSTKVEDIDARVTVVEGDLTVNSQRIQALETRPVPLASAPTQRGTSSLTLRVKSE